MIYETKSYSEGEYILKEGEIGRGFYILEQGILEVIRKGKIINYIDQQGAMFGELSQLLMHKRDASIIVKARATVKFFDVGLEEFVEKNPKLAVKVIRNIGRRLCRMNALTLEGNTKNNFLPSIYSDANSTLDPNIRILVVDDKQMIVDQIKGFATEQGWEIIGTSDILDAIQLAETFIYSAIIISCSLPDHGAIELRRKLKANPKSSNIPILGMVVQGDDLTLKKASEAGIYDFINKPLEKNTFITRLYEILKLDPSDQYFEEEENILSFKIPKFLTPKLFEEIRSYFKSRIKRTINEGIENVVIDLLHHDEVGEDIIELLGDFVEEIDEIGNPFKLSFVVRGEDPQMWQNLDGCEEAAIFENMEIAKENLC